MAPVGEVNVVALDNDSSATHVALQSTELAVRGSTALHPAPRVLTEGEPYTTRLA